MIHRNKRARKCETGFSLPASSALYFTKRGKVQVVFDFSIQLEHPVFALTGTLKLRYQVVCTQDVHAVCVFPSVSAFEHSDTVPPRGTLLVSGSLHSVTQTEQTPAPVPRLVLINYQQRLNPAAAGGKQRVKRMEENVACDSSTTGCLASGPLDMRYSTPIYFFCCFDLFFLVFFNLNVMCLTTGGFQQLGEFDGSSALFNARTQQVTCF